MAANFNDDEVEVDDSNATTEEEEEEEEGDEPKKRNPLLRYVLFGLAGLVVLCLVCSLGSRMFGGMLGLPFGGGQPAEPPVDTPAAPPTDQAQIPPTEPPVGGTAEPLPATEELVPAPPSEQPPVEKPAIAEAMDLVDTAVADGRFTTLATALTAAGLIETLKGAGPFTVFAPTDEAFAKLPAGALEGLLADKEALTKVLLYHVVSGSLPAADMVTLNSADTVAGLPVAIKVDGGKVMVNDAQVIIPDLAASNGIIHVIDTVLLPPVSEELGSTSPPGEQPAGTEEAGGDTTIVVIKPEAATPAAAPTVNVTIEADCANNRPPVADAGDAYSAMMGKGQAFVTFDGSGSRDPNGVIVRYTWAFGDGSAPGAGETVMHGYSQTGSFVATLTVTDACGDTAEDTANVTIVGPTPPAGTPVPTGTVTLPPTGSAGTPGFCHLVQPGQTLSGIAWYYGLTVTDLALINGVDPYYYVLAGQGLFIPTGPFQPGPNTYIIEAGDTLDSIAFQCGLQPSVLAGANGLPPGQPLLPGEWLVIPLWQW